MDPDTGDGPGLLETEVRPCLSRIRGPVDAVTVRGHHAPCRVLSHAHVHDVEVGFRDGDGPHRRSAKVGSIGDVGPGDAGIGGLPHAAAHRPHVVRQWIARDPVSGNGTSAPERPDIAPLHALIESRIVLCLGGLGGECFDACNTRHEREADRDQRSWEGGADESGSRHVAIPQQAVRCCVLRLTNRYS